MIVDGLITQAEFEAYTQPYVVQPANVANVEAAIETASRWCEQYTGRVFADSVTPTARAFDTFDGWTLLVDDFSTVTGLVVKSGVDSLGVYSTTWDATNYQAYPLNGRSATLSGVAYNQLVAVGQWFPVQYPGTRNGLVQVTARWGWAAIPAGVKRACATLALDLVKDPTAAFGALVGDFGVLRVRTHPRVAMLLDPYRRMDLVVGLA